MSRDLSVEAKQTFQIVALLATILVVGIHYKSNVPDFPSPSEASWNELIQEFVYGGIARVAVPLFAFAAGLFYFRSDDGSWRSYAKKLRQRSRSVLMPYFIVASVAMTSWLIVRRMEGNSVQMSLANFFSTWLLRPPAEQLWFLRDLMVLVIAAPLIRRLTSNRWISSLSIGTVACLWMLNLQVFPIVAGWHLLHMETLLFFMLGCAAVSKTHWIEKVGQCPTSTLFGLWLIWVDLVVLRICRRADFDIWYATDYGLNDLVLHQFSVVVGCFALFASAWRFRSLLLIRLSGASFFVYLVHEFPLRAIAQRMSDRFLDQSTSCWIVAPTVLIVCFCLALLADRWCPTLVSILTGGRTPSSAPQITTQSQPTAAGSRGTSVTAS